MRILYIDIDSLRPDHLGCYGYHRNTSPNIDRIADGARRFTNYYASDAPCLPSRTALFTGRLGVHTGVVNHGGAAADIRSPGSEREDGNRGEYQSWMTALRQAGHHIALVSPFPQRHAAWHVLDGFDEWHDTGGNGTERAEVVYPYAEEWLEDNADDEDWYLHVNFWDPHTDYDTPEEFGNPFEDEPAPAWPDEETIQEQRESYGPHSAQDLHHDYMTGGEIPELPRTPDEITSREDYKQWIDGYDVGIRYMDEYIGKLLDLLESKGVRDETLIIVSADHGENQGELNVYGDHQLADDKTCRVPLIVDGPGVEPGVDDGLYYNVDLAPTITELVGGDVPTGWDGRSFADSLTEGADDAGREFLVLSQGTWTCQRAVRWDDWLLIQTYHDGWREIDPLLLVDLDADPHETTNLADEHPEVVERGLSLLQRWHSDRMLENATGDAGGLPESREGLVDPLLQVVNEGLPYYQRGFREDYAERLRETGREAHAKSVEQADGVQYHTDDLQPPVR
ncbi:Arylsulfatase A [Natronoarchaeum philippinense]|uniref:Arylsulfatase A n=1 Tax=Natronoarchaeum philippinense TaxID=558529 RepID=A0A285P5N4_NATPI|nr:sulfatase [Natronoarchaeum philippinense]SNZ17034.1 Arylsulfatase A [Natronoarchaeum philippinense]